MSLALMLVLQAAPVPAAPDSSASAGIIPLDFDLKLWIPPDPCARGEETAEIVVCGRRNPDLYRITPLPGGYEAGPLVAEMGLGGGATGKVYVESVAMPDGQISKRIMFGVKMKF